MVQSPLEADDLEALLAVARSSFSKTGDHTAITGELAVRVPLTLGLTRDELAHFNRTWVDFDNKRVGVPPEMPCTCDDCTESPPEGLWEPEFAERVRRIPIHNTRTYALLDTWFRNEEMFLSPTEVEGFLSVYSEKLAWDTLSIRDLRRTCAYELAKAGRDADTIARFLGENPASYKDLINHAAGTVTPTLDSFSDSATVP